MIKEKELKPSEKKEDKVLNQCVKIQTAEGWKRAMLKKEKARKEKIINDPSFL